MTLELRELTVHNIRSYPHGAVRFGPGTSLIVGDVGSGKTSLLYAVEMALFGFAEVDAAHLIRHRAAEAEVRLVLGDDEHRYEFYRKFRRVAIRGRDTFKPLESSYARDGARVKYSATELRQRAIDLLGFPDNPNPVAHSDLWRWAVYVPQEKMREILGSAPQERLETIRKALGLEQYRLAAENAQTLTRELQSRAAVRESASDQLRMKAEEAPQWRRALAERQAGLASAREEMTMLKAALDASLAALSHLEAEGLRLREGEVEIDRLRGELARAKARAAERQQLLSDRTLELEQLRASASTLEAARGRLVAQSRSLEVDRGRLAAWRTEIERLNSGLGEAAKLDSDLAVAGQAESSATDQQYRAEARHRESVKVLKEVEAEAPAKEPPRPTARSVEEIDQALGSLEERSRTAGEELARLSLEADELEAMARTGSCPRCGQPVTAETASGHLEELRAARERRATDVAALDLQRAAVTEERRARVRYDRNYDRWRDAERRRTEARERLRLDEEELGGAQVALAQVRGEKAVLLAAREKLPPWAELKDEALGRLRALETKLASEDEEVRDRQREVDLLGAGQQRIPTLEAEVDRARKDATESRDHTTRLEEQANGLERQLARQADLGARLEVARSTRNETRSAFESAGLRLGHLESSVGEAEREIVEAEAAALERDRRMAEAAHVLALARWLSGPFREALEHLERRVLSRARGQFDRALARNFSTLIEDPALLARCDAAFSPEIEIDGEWTPAEALSGGERTALALAYRLALGEVVRSAGQLKLTTLILDEPTDGFSPEQVLRMGDLLEELAIRQVVLVSHEAALASVADRVVRVRKADGQSVIEDDGRPGPGAPTPLAASRTGRTRRRRTVTLDGPSA